MSSVEPLARYFRATDSLLERVEPTWWGAVVTDSRFPAIWDVNYARVDRAQPDLSLAEVEAELLPAIRRARVGHVHVVAFEPEGTSRLIADAERAGHKLSWEQVMRLPRTRAGPRAETRAGVGAGGGGTRADDVQELDHSDERAWAAQRIAYREFEVEDAATAEQLLRLARDVLTPAGRRWFGLPARGGGLAGIASLQVRDGVGYLDDVVTFPAFRRRGVATALVTRAVAEAFSAGAEDVVLIADRANAIRLYERLGFAVAGPVVSSLGTAPWAGRPRRASGAGR